MSARGPDDGGSDPACGASVAGATAFTVNGKPVSVAGPPLRRLADALRDDLGLTGTKVGCNAGDCGACTVLLDGAQVCSCMVSLAQAAGRTVETVEGLARNGRLNRLQRAFLRHGAAQCGACTPGMLVAATELLRASPRPRAAEVMDGLGGVLCRCTGYRKIVAAVLDAAGDAAAAARHAAPRRRRGRPARQARRRAQAHRPPSATAPTPCRPTRSGSASSARPMTPRVSRSATSRRPLPTCPAWNGCSPPATCRRTASASIPTCATSRCWPRAWCATAAIPCWPWWARARQSSRCGTMTCRLATSPCLPSTAQARPGPRTRLWSTTTWRTTA